VYPAREEGGRWRAVWYENGQRRQCEAVTEEKLAARLEKVTERLTADAPNMERPGADLIAYYLSPDRHPARKPWSPKHADTQRRLCQRFVAPVIAGITCQNIKVADMQKAVSAAPTEGEGARLHRCLSAMVTAGIRGGYLASPRLREVHFGPQWSATPSSRRGNRWSPVMSMPVRDTSSYSRMAGRRHGRPGSHEHRDQRPVAVPGGPGTAAEQAPWRAAELVRQAFLPEGIALVQGQQQQLAQPSATHRRPRPAVAGEQGPGRALSVAQPPSKPPTETPQVHRPDRPHRSPTNETAFRGTPRHSC